MSGKKAATDSSSGPLQPPKLEMDEIHGVQAQRPVHRFGRLRASAVKTARLARKRGPVQPGGGARSPASTLPRIQTDRYVENEVMGAGPPRSFERFRVWAVNYGKANMLFGAVHLSVYRNNTDKFSRFGPNQRVKTKSGHVARKACTQANPVLGVRWEFVGVR